MVNRRPNVLTATALFAVVAIASMAATFAGPSSSNDWQTIDDSVRPGDDFYRFANGSWLKANTIPPGRSSYDTSSMLREINAQRVRQLIQSAANATPADGHPATDVQKIGDYYASQMDTARIEALGLAPLSSELAAIAAIADRQALSAYLGRTLRPDDGTNTQTEGIFGVWIHQGFHDADRYAPHLVQGGLGMPSRDDYLDPASEKAALREAYRAHVAAVLKLANLTDADARAAQILALEIAIAKTHASRADTDDVVKTDNPWRRADFETKAPGMNWGAYFKVAGLDQQSDFVVWQPSAVIGTSALVAGQSVVVWKDYLTFHLVEHYAGVLPKAFGDEHSAFAGRLSGAPQAPDRAREAIAATNAAMGDAIGRLFVERYFPPRAKAAASAMVENIRAAFRARIAQLSWMSPETRAKALASLAALKIGLGYPDTWIDYSQLAIVRGDAYGNLRRAEDFIYQRDLAKLHRPVDPDEWELLLPQVVGAFLYFSPNTMQFSAGLLQPPYFDFAGDAASNYGSAGAGIAHEISHSFDELGSIYDAQGRLGNWWTADDLARHRAMAAPLIAQYDVYCPQPGLCVKGKQVAGESVADLVGLQLAHDAYVLSLQGRSDVVTNGLTGEQRFFLAFARRWRKLQTDAALRQQIASDIHPPGEYRSDTVRNVDAWYRAFAINPGDKLFLTPETRVRVW